MTFFLLIAMACTPMIPPSDEGGTVPAGTVPATAPASAEGEMTELTFYIAPERAACTGVAPMQCLQVKVDAADDYEFFYDGIDGFVYVPGYEYELRVARMERENPPADASAYVYTLLEVVSKVPAYEGEPVALEGTEWHLIAFGDEDMVNYQPDVATITATFADNQLSGNAGCNGYGGDYTIEGSTLMLSPIISTLMACADETVGTTESAYFAALASVGDYAIAGNLLTITYAAGQLTFMAAEPMTDSLTLEGTEWQLLTFGDEDTVAYDPEIAVITATFAEDRLSGNGGCNNYSGEYTVDGNAITFSPIASTRMACADETVSAAESAYFTALATASSYAIEGNLLTISYDAGQLIFTAAGSDVESTTAEVTCLFAGTGATISIDDKRANFTCGGPDVVLLGDVELGADGWMIEKATLERQDETFAATESALAMIHFVELADGRRCAWAGSGATLAVDDKRVNFTCDSEEDVLIGEIQLGEEGWMLETATVTRDDSGFVVEPTGMVLITGLVVQ